MEEHVHVSLKSDMTIHPKLSFSQKLLHKIRMKISLLGNYCNNNPGDQYAYNCYRFLASIFF